MRKYVKKFKADLGISLDGDADRVIMCDEKAQIIDGDQKNSILVKDLWTFEKQIQSKDLNWKLVETSNA